MIEVDARGLSCPIPVIRVKEAIEANPGEEVLVLLVDEDQRENVTRLAENKGYSAMAAGGEDGLDLKLVPPLQG